MKKNTLESLREGIIEALKDLYPKIQAQEEIILDFPSDERFGDLSTNIALTLSKQLRKAPRQIGNEIAEKIKANLQKSGCKSYIKEIKVEGAGFINFYFENSYFYAYLKEALLEGKKIFQIDYGKGRRVLIEFVSANPTGSLSVAHARQAAVGDSLAKVLNFLGFQAQKEYYLNDEGNQINILRDSVALRIRELRGEKVEFPENYYQGDYIYDIASKAVEKQVSPDQLGDFAAAHILEIIKGELRDFGVGFDYWYSQKELNRSGKIKEALAALKDKGFLYDSEGALWFKSTEFGDDKDRVVIKSDGSYTYLAPDIAYHEEKFKRGFTCLINLWGPDHHGYIRRLKAAVQAFGHPADSLSVIIVQLATIYRGGKPVQMSTRRGQYISLREVLDEVGADAARFFFMMRRISSHLDFDLEVAKKQNAENPVYYIQYAHARILSILRSSPVKVELSQVDFELLQEAEELTLIKKIAQLSSMLNICLETQDPYMLTVYLQELAEVFHKFYDKHKVLSDDKELTLARLALIEGARIALACGLDLLGISQPEKM